MARKSLVLAAVGLAALVASCETPPEPEPEPAPPPVVLPPPPVTLNQEVAAQAAVYVAFMRDVSTLQAGFQSADAIQTAMRRGAAYHPTQISQGMIAYASILALQSPEFVSGVRGYANDPAQRQQIIEGILADPAYAASFPGADAAAGLIVAALSRDSVALTAIADAIEGDAYTIQERRDPRRRWAITPITNREERLQATKDLSGQAMSPKPEEAATLYAAAHAGQGLNVSGGRAAPPYTPVVARALTIAALAALGAAGDDQRSNIATLTNDAGNQFCYDISKLNLFQCLAASRPSYEDMFCLGRHVVRDLASCAATAAGGVTTTITTAEAPRITPAPSLAPAAATTATLNSAPPTGR
jgi:hypothetical protein